MFVELLRRLSFGYGRPHLSRFQSFQDRGAHFFCSIYLFVERLRKLSIELSKLTLKPNVIISNVSKDILNELRSIACDTAEVVLSDVRKPENCEAAIDFDVVTKQLTVSVTMKFLNGAQRVCYLFVCFLSDLSLLSDLKICSATQISSSRAEIV